MRVILCWAMLCLTENRNLIKCNPSRKNIYTDLSEMEFKRCFLLEIQCTAFNMLLYYFNWRKYVQNTPLWILGCINSNMLNFLNRTWFQIWIDLREDLNFLPVQSVLDKKMNIPKLVNNTKDASTSPCCECMNPTMFAIVIYC